MTRRAVRRSARPQAAVVPALQSSMRGVLEYLRPNGVGFPCHDSVHARQRFTDAHRRVDAAHDNRRTLAANAGRNLAGARRLRGERRDADQVRTRHLLVARHRDILVDQGDIPLRRGQAGQHHQAQWLPHSIAVPPALLEPDDAHQRVRRVDEMKAQGLPPGAPRGGVLDVRACGRPAAQRTTLRSRRTKAPSLVRARKPEVTRQANHVSQDS